MSWCQLPRESTVLLLTVTLHCRLGRLERKPCNVYVVMMAMEFVFSAQAKTTWSLFVGVRAKREEKNSAEKKISSSSSNNKAKQKTNAQFDVYRQSERWTGPGCQYGRHGYRTRIGRFQKATKKDYSTIVIIPSATREVDHRVWSL